MLLFIDGFDHYATADITKKWSANSGAAILSTSGRRGGGALEVASTDSMSLNFTANLSAVIFGAAIKTSATIAEDEQLVQFLDVSTAQVSIQLRPDGSIRVYTGTDGGTVIATSLPGVAPIGQWFYFEAKIVFNGLTGAVEVRINGNTVIALTNADTAASANDSASVLKLSKSSTSTVQLLYDDLYLCDTLGSVNNDFLGDVRVDAYLPTSDGALSAWTPEPAGVHYTTVDEATPNTSDYISSATVGNKDTFGVPDMINTPLSIFGVQLAAAAWKTDAGFREIKGLVRISGTDYPSSALAVTETPAYKMKVWDQNPATSAAWTDAAVNAAEWGVEVA